MNAHATHTKQKSPRRYVPGSSRGRHSATTLLAQVADIERGQRIKARREELHLTQPAVVDLIEDAAKALPKDNDLHPDKAGKAPVSLRGYQTYERGGGIIWAKAKLLAQVLQMDVQAMMQGPSEDEQEPVTPDPFSPAPDERMQAMENRLMEQADIIRRLLEKQNGLLSRQSDILERIEKVQAGEDAAVERLQTATQRADEVVHRLDAAVKRVGSVLRGGTQRRGPAAKKPATKRTPRASKPKPD